jgi:hypothetical protein
VDGQAQPAGGAFQVRLTVGVALGQSQARVRARRCRCLAGDGAHLVVEEQFVAVLERANECVCLVAGQQTRLGASAQPLGGGTPEVAVDDRDPSTEGDDRRQAAALGVELTACSPLWCTTKSRTNPDGGLAATASSRNARRNCGVRVRARMASVMERPRETSVTGRLSATIADSSSAPARVGSSSQPVAAAAQADRDRRTAGWWRWRHRDSAPVRSVPDRAARLRPGRG